MEGIEAIYTFFDTIYEFITTGIYGLMTEAFAAFVKYMTLSYISWASTAVQFAWDVAKVIVDDLNLSAYLDSAWANIDSGIAGMLIFFNVPEAINVILSAFTTKFVLKFIPGV